MLERLENGVFTPKMPHMFSAYTTPKKSKKKQLAAILDLCLRKLGKGSHVIIVDLEKLHFKDVVSVGAVVAVVAVARVGAVVAVVAIVRVGAVVAVVSVISVVAVVAVVSVVAVIAVVSAVAVVSVGAVGYPDHGRHSLRYLGPKLWGKLATADNSAKTLKAFINRIRNIDDH